MPNSTRAEDESREEWLNTLSAVLRGDIMRSERRRQHLQSLENIEEPTKATWLELRAYLASQSPADHLAHIELLRVAMVEDCARLVADFKADIQVAEEGYSETSLESVKADIGKLLEKFDEVLFLFPSFRDLLDYSATFSSALVMANLDSLVAWLKLQEWTATSSTYLKNRAKARSLAEWVNSSDLTNQCTDPENIMSFLIETGNYKLEIAGVVSQRMPRVRRLVLDNWRVFDRMNLPIKTVGFKEFLSYPMQSMITLLKARNAFCLKYLECGWEVTKDMLDEDVDCTKRSCQILSDWRMYTEKTDGWDVDDIRSMMIPKFYSQLSQRMKLFMTLLTNYMDSNVEKPFYKDVEMVEACWDLIKHIPEDPSIERIIPWEDFCTMSTKLIRRLYIPREKIEKAETKHLVQFLRCLTLRYKSLIRCLRPIFQALNEALMSFENLSTHAAELTLSLVEIFDLLRGIIARAKQLFQAQVDLKVGAMDKDMMSLVAITQDIFTFACLFGAAVVRCFATFLKENEPEPGPKSDCMHGLKQVSSHICLLAVDWAEFCAITRNTLDSVSIEMATEWCKRSLDCLALIQSDVVGFDRVRALEPEVFKRLVRSVSACVQEIINRIPLLRMSSISSGQESLGAKHLKSTAGEIELSKASTAARQTAASARFKDLLETIETSRSEIEMSQRLVGKVVEGAGHEDRFSIFSGVVRGNFRWQCGKLLGIGSTGTVYMAINLDTGGLMAVKELQIKLLDDDALVNARRELGLHQEIHGPHVVEYYGVEIHRDRILIFLEYCPDSLANLLKAGPIDDEKTIASYTRQILLGLEFLHNKGIAHRDIKPRNILIGCDGTLKIADFGASKIYLQSPPPALPQLQAAGTLVGTPNYMSPEVIVGKPTATLGSADIWSLGCCVIEMVTGQKPWSSLEVQFDNEWAVMFQIGLKATHPPLPEESLMSKKGFDFLEKCFLPGSDRYTAAELLEHPWIAGARREE
ncbi:Suppressor of Sensor Kinase (SLN1) [Chytridiales sp. JEL 0842]|nr:Suppressor of Sensor Kinase (SLN1) [Chytridiales sp. JEL 0842]